MEIKWVKKCKEHKFVGYNSYHLGFSIQIGRLYIRIKEAKTEMVDKCQLCDKIQKL